MTQADVSFGFTTLNNSPIVATPDAPAIPLDVQADAAAAAGFDGFSPDVFSLRAWRDGGRSFAELREHLDRLGLYSIDLAGLTLSADRDASLAEIDELAAMTDALAPRWLLVRMTCPVEQALDLMATSAQRVAVTGTRVAIEFSAFTAINTPAMAVAVADEVGHGVGVLVDTWHFANRPMWDELAAMDPAKLAYVQISGTLERSGPTLADLQHDTMHRRTRSSESLAPEVAAMRHGLPAGWTNPIVCPEVMSDARRPLDITTLAQQDLADCRAWWAG